eukprot:TRINITY_DN5266_c0_g1_i1.p1 TRINITY_DN5266_c0_g1~~TRINITY_DN5266_c0_g1_i1.p1  ORF type:complete len:219 (+),score=68.53 TRINITY_DN5266_c0_g1_i1:48-704(+)
MNLSSSLSVQWMIIFSMLNVEEAVVSTQSTGTSNIGNLDNTSNINNTSNISNTNISNNINVNNSVNDTNKHVINSSSSNNISSINRPSEGTWLNHCEDLKKNSKADLGLVCAAGFRKGLVSSAVRSSRQFLQTSQLVMERCTSPPVTEPFTSPVLEQLLQKMPQLKQIQKLSQGERELMLLEDEASFSPGECHLSWRCPLIWLGEISLVPLSKNQDTS